MEQTFQFKQFTIHQDQCSMKVGTDGVLLGAWADGDGAARILDIGTGSGLIAIMLGQRNPTAQIHAVEIDDQAYPQAAENMQKCTLGGSFDGIPPIHSGVCRNTTTRIRPDCEQSPLFHGRDFFFQSRPQ
ncbi:MAG: methyltransferase [Haliscomenobacter sp.]|nr:methyltransferase [Haliscomenobacter sp.]